MRQGTVAVGYLDGGSWAACFGLSYRDLILRDALGGGRIVRSGGRELRRLCGTGGIVDGRNRVAASFLDGTDAEWLWFVDTDMGFADDTVDKLVESAHPVEAPVVGGLCFQLKATGSASFHGRRYRIQPTLFDLLEAEGPDGGEVGFMPLMDYPRDAVVQVAATGSACILIHRWVLDGMRAKFGDTWYDPVTHPTGNLGKPRTFSEDLSFCVRAAECGFPVYVNTAVKTTHDKHGIFLDEAAYDRDRAVDHGASD